LCSYDSLAAEGSSELFGPSEGSGWVYILPAGVWLERGEAQLTPAGGRRNRLLGEMLSGV